MSDPISRQQVIDEIVTWTVEDRPDVEMPTDLIDRIRALPSAQKTTGHWIIFPPCFEEICMCSNCKTKFKEAYQHRDTCPSCGARME